LPKKRRLLVLGPSFRRRKGEELLPAFERYDGLFFRIARKYLGDVKDVDVVVMMNDLTLADGETPLPYKEPEGNQWGHQTMPAETLEAAKRRNKIFLEKKLRKGKYSEIFLSMGKKYAEALPDASQHGVRVIFPATGGPGPKAQALKNWIGGRK